MRIEHAELREQRDGRLGARRDRDTPRAVRVGERALAIAHVALLRLALGDVHRDRSAGARDEREERIGHGVRRVRRDADLLELRLECIVARELVREATRRRRARHPGSGDGEKTS